MDDTLHDNDSSLQLLYLDIAGFNIKIEFHRSTIKIIRENYINQIRVLYRYFILIKAPRRIDLFIKFFDTAQIKIFGEKDKLFYINFLKIRESVEIITFYYIHPPYFQLILRYALLDLSKKKNLLLFHASSNIINNEVVLFSGKSGIGKTTVKNTLGEEYNPFSDDIVCIRKVDDKYFCFNTPFFEKNPTPNYNKKFAIKFIFFIKRSSFSKIIQIKNDDRIIEEMFSEVWTEKQYISYTIKNTQSFISSFDNFYFFHIKSINDIKPIFNSFINKFK